MPFLKWLTTDPDDYLVAFKQGFLNEREVAEDLKALGPNNSYLRIRMEYEFVRTLLARGQGHESLIWDALGFDQTESPSRLSEPVTVVFPVTTKSGAGKLVQALAFASNISYTNVLEASVGIRTLEKIMNQKLVVLFNDYFVGNSFMLPLFLAVASDGKVSKLFPHVCFTGAFNDLNATQPTDDVDVKFTIAKEAGKRLVMVEEVGNIKRFVNFVLTPEKPVPVFVGTRIDFETAVSELSKLNETVKQMSENTIEPDLFEKLAGRSLLLYEEGEIEIQSFVQFATAVAEFLKFRDVSPELGSELIPHIAFKGPVALAFIVGLKLKPYTKIALYHYENNSYHLVLDLRSDPRKLFYAPNLSEIALTFEISRNHVNETQLGATHVAVVVELSGRSIVEDVRGYLERMKVNAQILHIRPKTAGSIPVRDWTNETAAISKVLSSAGSNGATYHFFLSCPIPLAFGLGLCFKEDTQKICVYQYTFGDYHLVYSNVR